MQLHSTERVICTAATDCMSGRVRWAAQKSIWYFGHATVSMIAIVLFWDLYAICSAIALTAVTICMGHSVGMHRLLIHRSFKTYIGVEYVLVWLGTLVGMAGPFGMIRAHDMRDWHQRQDDCPPHPSHGAGFLKDAWWQLHCDYQLEHPPLFEIEEAVQSDRFYRLLELSWMLQQVPLAILLFALGGWPWVVWGISVRIFLSLTGHWAIGHFAHKSGQQIWRIDGLPVQGYNLVGFGLITFGENWHGNHHAYPYSARLGLGKGQSDLGFMFIQMLERIGLAWNIQLPGAQEDREGLARL